MEPRIIGVGELLWDMLATGPRMGGAPANFTCHTRALGADAAVISRVGSDKAGTRLLDNLRNLGVNVEAITVDSANPTGTVEVTLGADGQPHFEITRSVAWDHLESSPAAIRLANTANAICFGSLSQRSLTARTHICELVKAVPAQALKIFDVNLRGDFFTSDILDESLQLANVCKLSDSELPAIAGKLGLQGHENDQLKQLIDRYELRLVVYTRGDRGSILMNGTSHCEHAGLTTEVRDTIGAGDSFTATVAMGILQGWNLEEISDVANRVAAFVCSQNGAIPPLPTALRERFDWEDWQMPGPGSDVISQAADFAGSESEA